jgi:hypothetical protein
LRNSKSQIVSKIISFDQYNLKMFEKITIRLDGQYSSTQCAAVITVCGKANHTNLCKVSLFLKAPGAVFDQINRLLQISVLKFEV